MNASRKVRQDLALCFHRLSSDTLKDRGPLHLALFEEALKVQGYMLSDV